jgi:glycosyltransferase involved in cell wall biosynthesis
MKILACAYACLKDPDVRFESGGEGFLGWSIVEQLSRFNNVWVFVHFQNRKAIEEKLAKTPNSQLHFYYISLPRWMEFLNRYHGGIQIYAYLWQIKAYGIARALHQEVRFDLFQHVTYANDWMASYIGALLPVPYIRGPGGASPEIPRGFIDDYSFKDRFQEWLRSFGHVISRHDPFFILGQSRAKAILVCNKEAYETILAKWKSKTYLFPVTGISSKELASLSRHTHHGNPFHIMIAGKLVRIKGFDLAIKSFKLFSDKAPNAILTIVGDGPDDVFLKGLIKKLDITQKVRFLGWQPHQALLEQMSQADVFLFPSLRDGGGAVVVEAMAASKPVVCLDVGGPGYHIDATCGIKVTPQSPDQVIGDLAKALNTLYTDSHLRASLGAAARKKAEQYYCWDRLGDQLQGIYGEKFKVPAIPL